MITKRKKVTKYRGSKTHGCGSMKKRRGAGNRGGRGMAGSGKRADHKRQLIFKKYGTKYFGKHGFKVNSKIIKIKAINVTYLESNLSSLIKKGLAKDENKLFTINLSKLGYNKLLGSGKITKKFNITTKFVSKKAKEKVEKLGGKIVTI